jgi:hypothetical protein
MTVAAATALAAASLTITIEPELELGSWPTSANDAGPDAINHNDAETMLSLT